MATLQQALTRIDAICPNAWDETAKLLWLNECESMIQTRILGVAPEQCITYDADTDRSTALLVPAPFDRLYVYYVIAMCDYAAHETAHYADSMMLFNAALDEYAKWYQRANGAAPIAPGQLQQIAANTKARHTHENLAVLDGITAEKAAAWDAKADRTAATASANGLMSKADKAKLDGIAAGTSASTFAPNDVITREQMAVILYGYTAKFAPEFTGNAASLNTFPDAGSVANWAYAAMSWAVGNGLISGMGSGGVSYLAPQGSATRAQASAIIMRYCQLIGQ